MSSKKEVLPSVDSVLSKLKGDGTFDQFRKTCLGHIQGEPSFRSYSEHIEVVSRRYLQNYKWKESSSKNEVRGRLRDHALGVIVSPDIQVGTPLIDIVEKVLESKAKELLPKITEAVDNLCEAKSKQIRERQLKKEVEPTPLQSQYSNTDTHKSDFVDLSIPFDLPGLNPSKKDVQPKKEPSGTGNVKKEGDGKVRAKAKTDSLKDPKAGTKSKLGALKTNTSSKDGGKIKSDQKLATDKEAGSKEKEKPKFRIPKKPRIEKESADKQEKANPPESSSDIKTDDSKTTSDSATKDGGGPKLTGKRRSARIASQSDSKASSDNDPEDSDLESEISTPPVKKRRRSSSQTGKKRAKVMIHSSSDESENSGYESDTSEESVLETVEEHKKRSKSAERTTRTREKSTRKSKPTQKLRASKSPPVVVTRYNRSVKPNRKYFTDSVEIEDEDAMLEETEEQEREAERVTPLILDTTRPCDSKEMEIQEVAISSEGGVVHEMFTPKPPPLKIRKTLVKGLRSRKKTNTRINFFCHR